MSEYHMSVEQVANLTDYQIEALLPKKDKEEDKPQYMDEQELFIIGNLHAGFTMDEIRASWKELMEARFGPWDVVKENKIVRK